MSIYDGFAQDLLDFHKELREAMGTTIKLLETGGEWKANVLELAPNDFPLLDIQGENDNAEELDPRQLDNLDPAFDGQKGWHVLLPATGDAEKDCYVIEAVQDFYEGDTVVKKRAFVYLSPNREGS